MNLLGIDTSTAVSAACVLRVDGEAFEEDPPADPVTHRPAHAAELMPAVARCLERAGLDWPDLGAIALGVGPGAFTGLRIGVATARALAGAHGLELRPVSSLRALAEGIGAPARLALTDARRGELFAALYDEHGERIAPFVAPPEEVILRVRAAGGNPLAAGTGSLRFREALEVAGVPVAPPESGAHVVRGLSVCRVATTASPAPPEAVLPDYLRPPDAQPR